MLGRERLVREEDLGRSTVGLWKLAEELIGSSRRGHNGICYRRQAGGENVRANLSDFPKDFLEDLYDTIIEDELVDNNILPGALKRGWLGMRYTQDSATIKYKSSWVFQTKEYGESKQKPRPNFFRFHWKLSLQINKGKNPL